MTGPQVIKVKPEGDLHLKDMSDVDLAKASGFSREMIVCHKDSDGILVIDPRDHNNHGMVAPTIYKIVEGE